MNIGKFILFSKLIINIFKYKINKKFSHYNYVIEVLCSYEYPFEITLILKQIVVSATIPYTF